MGELRIERLKELCAAGQTIWTEHTMKRIMERRISRADVKACIMSGEIIEQYPDDYPYPSCLVFGCSVEGRALHVVAGEGDGSLWIITAYWPDPLKWDDTLKIRKER